MREIWFSVIFCGIPATVFGMLAAAALLTYIELSGVYYTAAAAIPLLGGCLLCGRVAGKRLRRGGIRCGLLSALLLTSLWYAAACLLAGRLFVPMLSILTLPCGVIGGICGVNTRLPLPHKRMHTAQQFPQRLMLSRQAASGIRRVRAQKRTLQQAESDAKQSESC